MSQDFAQTRLHQCARAYAKALAELRSLDGKVSDDSPREHELRTLRREVHETEYDLLEAARNFHKASP